MKTLKFMLYDEPMEVFFVIDSYTTNDNLAIMAYNKDGEFYGDVTTCIPFGYVEENEFYASNNSEFLIKAMIKEKLIKDLDDSISSGYAIFHKMKITKKFMEYVKE